VIGSRLLCLWDHPISAMAGQDEPNMKEVMEVTKLAEVPTAIKTAASPLRRCGEATKEAARPEAADERAAARMREQITQLWEAVDSASPPPEALESLKRQAAIARAAAEAEFERRWHFQLWDMIEANLDQESLSTVVKSMRGASEPLPVHVVRRIFDMQPQQDLARGAGRRSSSRVAAPPPAAALPAQRRRSDPSVTRQERCNASARENSRTSLGRPGDERATKDDPFRFLPLPSEKPHRGRATDHSPSVRDRVRHLEVSQSRVPSENAA